MNRGRSPQKENRVAMYQKVIKTKSGNEVAVELVRTSFNGPDLYDMIWRIEPSEGDMEEAIKALGIEEQENMSFCTEGMSPLEVELVTQRLLLQKKPEMN